MTASDLSLYHVKVTTSKIHALSIFIDEIPPIRKEKLGDYPGVVGRERLELSTNGLRVHCSTN